MSETGISTRVLKGANVTYSAGATNESRPQYVEPDMSQDHLEALNGDLGALALVVEHVAPGREAVRGLPGHLEVSPHN